ncbi:MAG: AAA family ATPase, partial [Clostridia bacterium]|nr:AAA family ATPase [Clostridia bacterium]
MPITNEADILRNLQVQNTWWTTGKVEDGLAPEFKRSVYKRVCKIFFNEIRRFPVLSGPRRVGKSTMMFQVIDKLLNDGVMPERILFYTLDEFPNDGIAIKE